MLKLQPLTVVMYHYVRDLTRSRYPRIRGLTVDDFRVQLKHLQERFQIVSMNDVVAASRGETTLPADAAVLTFDDGYLEHYTIAFPLLAEAGLSGAFYPPAGAVQQRELLDVNRIHFMLAGTDDHKGIVSQLDALVDSVRSSHDLPTRDEYWSQFGIANRFDTAEVIYIKRMLQVGLPEHLRTVIGRRLFQSVQGIDEAVLAEELYLTVPQLKVMHANGMHIGSHGDRHVWLNSLTAEQQRDEIDASLEFLRQVHPSAARDWTIAYPYGGWNESLLEVVQSRGGVLGFTTQVAQSNLGADRPLLLPRFDTNDFYPRAKAA
jgi:peptidoglycan/xylan/chitin deacetylase (PgdA/CDA1 family)